MLHEAKSGNPNDHVQQMQRVLGNKLLNPFAIDRATQQGNNVMDIITYDCNFLSSI